MLSYDYTSIFLIVLNAFVFVLFLFLVFVILKHYRSSTREEEEVIKHNAFKKATEMLEEARQKSLQILEESNQKSKEVIKNMEFLTEDSKKQLENEFNEFSKTQVGKMEKLSQDLLGQYSHILEEERVKGIDSIKRISAEIEQDASKNLDEFKQVSIDLEKEALHELDDFKNALASETIESEKLVEGRVNKEYDEMKVRIKAYEDEKMRQIDTSINRILAEVSKEIFGTSIDLATSEEMVMAALEHAKKEGMFE